MSVIKWNYSNMIGFKDFYEVCLCRLYLFFPYLCFSLLICKHVFLLSNKIFLKKNKGIQLSDEYGYIVPLVTHSQTNRSKFLYWKTKKKSCCVNSSITSLRDVSTHHTSSIMHPWSSYIQWCPTAHQSPLLTDSHYKWNFPAQHLNVNKGAEDPSI